MDEKSKQQVKETRCRVPQRPAYERNGVSSLLCDVAAMIGLQ